MTNSLEQNFLNAYQHYQNMLKQYGEDHPITQNAFMLTWHYSPESLKKEIYQEAQNLLPKASGYLDDNSPIYSLEDMAKHFGISYEEAEQKLLTLMDNRKQLGLSNDGILINSNIHINRVQ